MRRIGILTTTTFAAVMLSAAYLAFRAIPDIQRYLKIRAM